MLMTVLILRAIFKSLFKNRTSAVTKAPQNTSRIVGIQDSWLVMETTNEDGTKTVSFLMNGGGNDWTNI